MIACARWVALAASAFVLSALADAPAHAQERVQEFNRAEITAHLDDEGTLHVTERHDMTFTGDWNGGERTLQLGANPLAVFELRSLTRLDPSTGLRYPLSSGDLTEIDEYAVVRTPSTVTLRWRSRLPGYAPFDHTPLSYVIEYAIHGAVRSARGGTYSFSHEFVPARESTLGELWVRLTFDPSWKTTETLPDEWRLRDVPPHGQHLVQAQLTTDAWLPSRLVKIVLAGLFVPAFLLAWFIWSERGRGRIGPVERVPASDPAWLAEHLFRYKPEVAAVLWTASPPGPDAVTALIARLELEGKITTRVEDHELVMELRVDRARFDGYERRLIDALFFDGDRTGTAQIRKHYGSFKPAKRLEPELLHALRTELGPFRSWLLPVWLPELIAVCIAQSYVLEFSAIIALVSLGVLLMAAILGAELARQWRSRPEWGLARGRNFLLVAGVPVAVALVATLGSASLRTVLYEILWGAMLLALANCKFVLEFARSRESPRGNAVRRQLNGVRQYLHEQLQRRAALPDELIPYVFALGLGPEARLWFGLETDPRPTYGDRVASSRSSSGERYEGGGGAFGGAGASGSWVDALGAFSVGTGAGSSGSSGSSSSSSSSSGSSGGGSIGGW